MYAFDAPAAQLYCLNHVHAMSFQTCHNKLNAYRVSGIQNLSDAEGMAATIAEAWKYDLAGGEKVSIGSVIVQRCCVVSIIENNALSCSAGTRSIRGISTHVGHTHLIFQAALWFILHLRIHLPHVLGRVARIPGGSPTTHIAAACGRRPVLHSALSSRAAAYLWVCT